jgi:hypothetical protein
MGHATRDPFLGGAALRYAITTAKQWSSARGSLLYSDTNQPARGRGLEQIA